MIGTNFYNDIKLAALLLVAAAFALGGAVGHLMTDGSMRVVQGVSGDGPVCMQARARDVVEADGLCIVGQGDAFVAVHYCRVGP